MGRARMQERKRAERPCLRLHRGPLRAEKPYLHLLRKKRRGSNEKLQKLPAQQRSVGTVVEDRCGDVIPLLAAAGQRFECGEGVSEKIDGRFRGVAVADIQNALQAELLIANVAGLREAITAEKDGVAGLQLKREFVIRDTGQETGGIPALSRTRHSWSRRRKGPGIPAPEMTI
jgi:hypothetical protein